MFVWGKKWRMIQMGTELQSKAGVDALSDGRCIQKVGNRGSEVKKCKELKEKQIRELKAKKKELTVRLARKWRHRNARMVKCS
jgi:hypothetical protein